MKDRRERTGKMSRLDKTRRNDDRFMSVCMATTSSISVSWVCLLRW
jgi:hypothetical protein